MIIKSSSLLFLFFLFSAKIILAQKDELVTNTAISPVSPATSLATAINIYAAPMKAARDFAKTFKDAENIQWYKLEDGYVVLYSCLEQSRRTGYDSRGNWLYNLLHYGADKLPADIYQLVRSTYYDYSISQVDEIQQKHQVIYVIHMEDKNTWQNIRVVDGQMEILEQYRK